MEEEVSLATGDSISVKKEVHDKGSDERRGWGVAGSVVCDHPEEVNVSDSVVNNNDIEINDQAAKNVNCVADINECKSAAENADNESQAETRDHSHGEETSDAVFEDFPLSKSVDFMFETKYVMLNFMSLIPPDIYRGHISTSPEAFSFERDVKKNFLKSNMHLSKSKSFDTGIQSRKPRLKTIGKLKTMEKHLESPASEDNVNYHYQTVWKTMDSPDCERFHSDPSSQHATTPLFEKSQSAHAFSSSSSPAHSPHKSISSPQRQYSDLSSSEELSYISDADDEYDEFSNASSIFSARSISSRDGFLDLRRSVHILPTLPSQSEDTLEVDAFALNEDDSYGTPVSSESSHHGKLPEKVKHNLTDADDDEDMADSFEGLQQTVYDVDARRTVRQPADRSKLKLMIPSEPVQLDDILVSLQTELSSELDELESEFEEALQSARDRMTHSAGRTPLTPQSEAARVLARIGDEVKEQYGARLAEAVNRLTYQQLTGLSYQQFRDIAQSIVSAEMPGWRQVALLMVFGQRIIWGAVQQGQTHFGNLIDYCSQLVAEVAADFIIKQGGWGSVMNFDPSSDNQSSGDFDTSPEMVIDYFTNHDVTQVESEEGLPDLQKLSGNNETCKVEEEQKQEPYDTRQVDNIEPDKAEMKTLPVDGLDESRATQKRSRYASSVGFDYTDQLDNLAEGDMKTDSEEDRNVVEQGESKSDHDDDDDDDESGRSPQNKAVSITDNSSTHGLNDLNKTNAQFELKASEYYKQSIFVGQNIPVPSADHSINKDFTSYANAPAKSTSDSGVIERQNNSSVTMNNKTNEEAFDDKIVNSQTEDTSSQMEVRDIPEHSSDPGHLLEPSINNNQNKTEEDQYFEDANVPNDNICDNKIDLNRRKGKDAENESNIPAVVKRMSIKVAALALAVVVLGISVRLATLNR